MLAGDCEAGACGTGIADTADGGGGNFILVIFILASSLSKSTFGAPLSDACGGDARSGIAATRSAAILSRQ